MIVFEKYGQHHPLNRQAVRYAREGVDLSLSTRADQGGAVTELLMPLHALIEAHVFAAARLHGPSRQILLGKIACRAMDATTVPLLTRGGTKTARLWTCLRDDRPFGGTAPPAVVFRFSRDRGGEHPGEHLKGWQGLLQADAYAGDNQLYDPGRQPGPVAPALCWSHARRKFFERADVETNIRKGKSAKDISPIAVEAVKRVDALFVIERTTNAPPPPRGATGDAPAPVGPAGHRSGTLAAGRTRAAVEARQGRQGHRLPAVAQALAGLYPVPRDGRVCLSNNAAERSLRGVALGRKSWLFAGSKRGGQRAAAMYTPIGTAKLNDIDPQAWLADVIARISDTPVSRLHKLLPWHWNAATPAIKAA